MRAPALMLMAIDRTRSGARACNSRGTRAPSGKSSQSNPTASRPLEVLTAVDVKAGFSVTPLTTPSAGHTPAFTVSRHDAALSPAQSGGLLHNSWSIDADGHVTLDE